MKKYLLSIFTIVSAVASAQNPQFAVVRPDGTTFICPTFDSAYRKAVNDDVIYLPGGLFTLTDTIKKKVNFWGAGISPDSTIVTGKTAITSKVKIASEASGSSFQGISFTYSYCSYYCDDNSVELSSVSNIYFQRCEFRSISGGNNLMLRDCILKGSFNSGNSFVYNSIIGQSANSINTHFYNSIFLSTNVFNPSNGLAVINSPNSRFENNIFLSVDPFYHGYSQECGNVLLNNLKIGNSALSQPCSAVPPVENGTLHQASIDDIFINYPSTDWGGFGYQFNYQLKTTCLGHNAGTDGTDIGIYGSTYPANAGWVPSNPHIYFKQVAPQTNSNGQLPIQFKVRTSN